MIFWVLLKADFCLKFQDEENRMTLPRKKQFACFMVIQMQRESAAALTFNLQLSSTILRTHF